MARTMKIFCIRKNFFPIGKTIYCSFHAILLLCKTSINTFISQIKLSKLFFQRSISSAASFFAFDASFKFSYLFIYLFIYLFVCLFVCLFMHFIYFGKRLVRSAISSPN